MIASILPTVGFGERIDFGKVDNVSGFVFKIFIVCGWNIILDSVGFDGDIAALLIQPIAICLQHDRIVGRIAKGRFCKRVDCRDAGLEAFAGIAEAFASQAVDIPFAELIEWLFMLHELDFINVIGHRQVNQVAVPSDVYVEN